MPTVPERFNVSPGTVNERANVTVRDVWRETPSVSRITKRRDQSNLPQKSENVSTPRFVCLANVLSKNIM